MRRYILLAWFYLFVLQGHSQGFDTTTWHYIDTSIQNKRNLSDINDLVQRLKQKAWTEKKYFNLARCYHYQVMIADKRTEDSFYFRNSAVYDSLLMTQQDKPELQFALHMLQANRLAGFAGHYHHFGLLKYKWKELPVNYALYDGRPLDSISQIHFEQAKTLAKNISLTNIEDAGWLSSDPDLFLFKPGLFDIAITEQIRSRETWYYSFNPAIGKKIKFIRLPQDEFIARLDSLYAGSKPYLKELNYYREWLNYHAAAPEAYYYIESLLRKYVYETIKNNNDPGPDFDNDYEFYLQQTSLSSYTTVRAHCVFQLCLKWDKLSERYFPIGRAHEYRYDPRVRDYHDISGYDTAYRYHSRKAMELFEQNKPAFDHFFYLRKQLLAMEKRILAHTLSMAVPEYNLPHEPLLAELTFKNAGKLYYSIVRMNAGLIFNYREKDELMSKLRQLPEVASNAIDLPASDDYNWHETYVRLESLPAGTYSLLFSFAPINDTNKQIERVYLKITSIAVTSNNSRVFILDIKTGFPLPGATVRGLYSPASKDTTRLERTSSKNYIVNEHGYTIIKDEKIRKLAVYYKEDTSFVNFSVPEKEDQAVIYNKDVFDNLVDYYNKTTVVHLFTDRSIYRPGQTVHFKAIFLTADKNTGETIVANKENMGKSLFRSMYQKWLKELDSKLYLSDPFSRNMDSLKVQLNEYGSVAGSFKIPKTATTGNWSIEMNTDKVQGKGGVFSVEEYKRPSYEITIENPNKELLPTDTFTVKVKVRSFAGATLNNVRINYTIQRSGSLPFFDSLTGKMTRRTPNVMIADTSAYTNADGELFISVNDSLLKQFSLAKDTKWDFYYTVSAQAIDATGESYKAGSDVFVSSRPVNIVLPQNENYSRNEKSSLPVTASDVIGTVYRNIRVKIYRVIKDVKVYDDRLLIKADQWLYSVDELEKWFPSIDFRFGKDKDNKRELVLDKTVNTGKMAKIDIDPSLFTAGEYKIEATCEDKGQVIGKEDGSFNVFDVKENKLPRASYTFYHLDVDEVLPGDTIKYYNGNSEGAIYSLYTISWYSVKKKLIVSDHHEIIKQERGIHEWKWKVPADAKDKLLLTQTYIFNNQAFTNKEEITIRDTSIEEPEIIIEQYRKKMAPGSRETFSVSIKTKNENKAAELMTTLYDASLDKLQSHNWDKPETDPGRRLENSWVIGSNPPVSNYSFRYEAYHNEKILLGPQYIDPSGWGMMTMGNTSRGEDVMGDWNNIPARRNIGFQSDMNPDIRWSANEDGDGDGVAYDYNPRWGTGSFLGRVRQEKLGELNVAGILMNRSELRNYQKGDVVKYLLCPAFPTENTITTQVPFLEIGTNETKSLTATIVRISKERPLVSYKQSMTILDGNVFEGDLTTIDPGTITQIIILKGADAVEIYGPNAANGVLILSTKGNIILPVTPPDAPVVVRKNFNETAFFFPTIYADKEGYYKFTFTMPESVTEWNWKMLAHTKKAQFAYAERKLNTQLPLMVQPNMPGLLYQGDRIILQSRISNLDSIDAGGKATCQIEDAVTGEDITSSFLAKTENEFSVAKKGNISSAFEIRVPKTQLNPVKIVISVHSRNFTDGEEHIIPVLSPKILARENIPFRFSAVDTTLKPVQLPAGSELYGIGLSILPKPQSALINALPWLANYSFDCAEQTFNKLLARVTALKIMRADKEGQQSFDKAKQIVDQLPEQKEQMPGELSEETMPWLSLETKNAHQQKQLFELLDTTRSIEQMDNLISKLYKLQNKDGGFSWFDGSMSNAYISNYVLAGFGKLEKDSLLIPDHLFGGRYVESISKLVAYCDKQFRESIYSNRAAVYSLFYFYARSFWKEKYSLVVDSSFKQPRDIIKEMWKNAGSYSLYNQAILVITTLRYFDKGTAEYEQAVRQLGSIEQLAIEDDVNGVRWKDLADNEELGSTAEETIAVLADAFAEGGVYPGLSKGIVQWLLGAKNEDHWSSTKSTSAVIGLLSKEKKTVTGATQAIDVIINNQKLSVTDDLLSGNNFSFVKSNSSSPVELKKQMKAPAAGNLIEYYFSPGDNLSKLNKKVSLSKELFRFNEATAKWDPVNEQTSLKIADKIKVVLTIECSKYLYYVYIDDKKAAAFEPKEINSGYQYTHGLSYYRSVRDAGMQLFAESIPSGRSVISYEMIVAHEGDFTNGPAILQCLYKPEVNAYSNSIMVKTTR